MSHSERTRPRDLMYSVWRQMLGRCENPADKDYQNYGARGIKVCERWHDFGLFLSDIEYSIGKRPEGTHPSGVSLYSLDRIDNDRDYEPGNVRWATGEQQLYNSRRHYGRREVVPGERHGRLVVLREVEPILSRNASQGATKHRAVLCRCGCGTEVTVKLGNLRGTSSCGCLKRERMRDVARERFTFHDGVPGWQLGRGV